MRELMDRRSGLWVVAYTEQVVKTEVYILIDVYFNLQFWSVSPHLARALDELDLGAALGCAANVVEFQRLLGVIESTNYAVMPYSWKFRGDASARVGENQNRRGWGHQGPGADLIYYDPWRSVSLSEEQSKQQLRDERRKNLSTFISKLLPPSGGITRLFPTRVGLQRLLLGRWSKYPARAGIPTCWRRL